MPNIEGAGPVPKIDRYGVVVPDDYGSLPNYDKVRAKEAWYKLSCLGIVPQQVTVAIIDNAINLGHEDLTNVRWVNTAEMGGVASVDDDGNGYVDDFYGWDMSDNDNNTDEGSICADPHGTHVAGIAAAQTRNGVGVSSSNISISPSTNNPLRIMALKIFQDTSTQCDYLDGLGALYAIDYATDKHVGVINMSWGFLDDTAYYAYANFLKRYYQRGCIGECSMCRRRRE